jgi:hypothetical protein
MKKSVMTLAAAVCAAMVVTAAEAQTRPGFEVGAEVLDYGNRERFEGETVAKDDGRFIGFTVGYTKKFGATFLRGRMSVDLGSVDYRSDDGETRLDDVSQGIGQLEVHIGRDFTVRSGATITPFAGLASRYLTDESGGEETENGFLGYDREVRYRYVPLGVAAAFPLRRRAMLTVSGQYNWLVGGNVESHFSEIDPEFPDVSVDLNDGSGYELSAMLAVPIGRHRLSFGPFVRSWKIDQSETFVLDEELELFEPDNRTREVGVRVTFAF